MESSQLLTDDCWEMIVNRLDIQADQSLLDRLSLVSKQLLSVTNQILPSLKVFVRTKPLLPVYLQRFPNVKMIDLSDFSGDITSLLHDLAQLNLNLQGLDLSSQKALPLEDLKEIASKKWNFQVLKCSRLSILRDSEVIAIGDTFPLLEELDISYPSYASAVTDESITALSTKLSNLGKINLAGNHSLSDKCLKSLATNCKKLREVIFHHCGGMTQDGLAFLVENNPNLVTLSLALPEGISPTISIPFAGLRALHTLELFYMKISDQLLFEIAYANVPLKRFALCHCKEFSFTGIIFLLHRYSLESIALADIDFLDDKYLVLFANLFTKTTSIKITCCPKLTYKALHNLLCICRNLQKLELARTGLGDNNCRDLPGVNLKLESLNLSGNILRGKAQLRRIALFCPNLMCLDLSGCIYVSKGIIDILENCNKIRHLKINSCPDITYVKGTSKFERLESLHAVESAMGDRTLTMFAKRSPELRSLNLRY